MDELMWEIVDEIVDEVMDELDKEAAITMAGLRAGASKVLGSATATGRSVAANFAPEKQNIIQKLLKKPRTSRAERTISDVSSRYNRSAGEIRQSLAAHRGVINDLAEYKKAIGELLPKPAPKPTVDYRNLLMTGGVGAAGGGLAGYVAGKSRN